jgi:hypothetical protein
MEQMDFHQDRIEGSHLLSTANIEQVKHEKPSQELPIQIKNTSVVIWEQAHDQGSLTCKGHARTETTTTVDKMSCFSSSSMLQTLWRSMHIPNLKSIPHRW